MTIHTEIPSIAHSEDVIALAFAEHHGDEFRYVHATSPRKWFVLNADSGEWEVDVTLLHLDVIRYICREAALGCDDPHLARELCSARTMIAVEQLARSDRRLASTRDQVGLPPPGTRKRRAAPKTGQKRTIAGTEPIAVETDNTDGKTTMTSAIIARARKEGAR